MQNKYFLLLIFFFIYFQNVKAENIIGIARVIDGDTIEINKKKVRLFGIDAPEIKQKCKRSFLSISFLVLQKKYDCGVVSKKKLEKKIKDRIVKCVSDKGKDRYGRFIAICYSNNYDLNKWLVRNGYAIAYKKFSKKYSYDEEYAKEKELGLWSGNFMRPEKWRKIN